MNSTLRHWAAKSPNRICISIASAAILTATSVLSAAGCGSAQAPSQSDFSAGSLGQAEQEADAAEARLNAAIGRAKTTPPTLGTSNPQPIASSSANPGPGPEPAHPTSVPPTDPQAGMMDSADPCQTACDALTSMIRAVDHLCNITGQGDERCQNRRARVDEATTRVVASCPSCNV